LLGSQLGEITENLEAIGKTFAGYRASVTERETVFANFRKDLSQDYLDQFKNELLHHLSS
jgi:hypothetical protein